MHGVTCWLVDNLYSLIHHCLVTMTTAATPCQLGAHAETCYSYYGHNFYYCCSLFTSLVAIARLEHKWPHEPEVSDRICWIGYGVGMKLIFPTRYFITGGLLFEETNKQLELTLCQGSSFSSANKQQCQTWLLEKGDEGDCAVDQVEGNWHAQICSALLRLLEHWEYSKLPMKRK